MRGHRNCHWDWLASGSRVPEVHDVITHLDVVLGEQVLVNVLTFLQGPQQPTCRELHLVVCRMNLAIGTGVLCEFRRFLCTQFGEGILIQTQTLSDNYIEKPLVILTLWVNGHITNHIVNLAKLQLQHLKRAHHTVLGSDIGGVQSGGISGGVKKTPDGVRPLFPGDFAVADSVLQLVRQVGRLHLSVVIPDEEVRHIHTLVPANVLVQMHLNVGGEEAVKLTNPGVAGYGLRSTAGCHVARVG